MKRTIVLIALLAAAGGANAQTKKTAETRAMSDVERIVKEVEPTALAGLPAAQLSDARSELSALVADWLREAGHGSDADDILALSRREFLERLQGKSPAERRDIVRWQSLERRVRRLSVASYALGQKVVDKKIAADQARKEGEALVTALDALAPAWQAVADANVKARLQRDIQESRMEALYAIEQKAMSLRLGRYASDRSGGPKVTP